MTRPLPLPLLFLVVVSCLVAPSLAAQVRYRAIAIPVRDGQSLAADLYSTDTAVARPTIVVQTPYDRTRYRLVAGIPPEAGGRSFPWDTAHYNYVVVDWRGFYGSRDAADDGYDRGLDGYDVVEWVAAQRWCDGKVGTWGPSALGLIQYQTARHRPPHLVCAVPLVKDFKTKYTDYYEGGEYRREHVEVLQSLGFANPETILSRPTYDNVWRAVERATEMADEIAIPMLLIGGWYDHFPDDVLRAFEDLRTTSDPAVRAQHRLVMGPWLHSGIDQAEQGELSYPNAVGLADSMTLAFFDHHLRGVDNGIDRTPVTQYYQMGHDEWRSAGLWRDLVDAGDTIALYPTMGGVLAREPGGNGTIGGYTYDPRDPTPVHGGSRFPPIGSGLPVGPLDQRQVVESRTDVVIYETPVLAEDLEVVGAPRFVAMARPTTPDADIVVRLSDVHPDGRSMLVTQGVRRLRFRNGFEPRDTMAWPVGVTQQVEVRLQNLAMTWRAGHRLRISVSGAAWPHFERNLNTGGPLYGGTDTAVATVELFGSDSWLALPVPARTSGIADDGEHGTTRLTVSGVRGTTSTIGFTLERSGHVSIVLHDLLGRAVMTLVDGEREAGTHTAPLDATALPRGSYLLVMRGSATYSVLRIAY